MRVVLLRTVWLEPGYLTESGFGRVAGAGYAAGLGAEGRWCGCG